MCFFVIVRRTSFLFRHVLMKQNNACWLVVCSSSFLSLMTVFLHKITELSCVISVTVVVITGMAFI